MIERQWTHRLTTILAPVLMLTAMAALGRPATADEWDKADLAIKLIPDDAAFYSSSLRNREQFAAIRHSNAWAKIEHMPAVQMIVAMYRMQTAIPNSGPAKLERALQNPEVRKLVDLAKQMVSDEVWAYGDDSCIDFLELVQNVMGAVRYGPGVMQAAGQAGDDAPARAVMAALTQNIDLIAAPDIVVGFKLKNVDLAKEELIKLETMANIVLESNEQTKGRFKRTKVGDNEFLVLMLDGSMLPWDQMPIERLKEAEAHEGDAQKIIDRLKESQLVLALGIRDNYLLASIGSSLEALQRLGQGKLLVDRAELKPLAKFADKRLTSLGYVSKDLNKQVNNQRQSIDNTLELVNKLLPLAKLSAEQDQRIKKDAAALAEDLKRLIPKAGAQAGLSFLCDRGIESWQYSWGDYGRLDSSKPLGLLEHVGGNPILAIVARAKTNVADYDLLVKWIKLGYGYVEDFGLPNAPPAQREQFTKFMKTAKPLSVRLDKANREMLIPALADGQSAVVIDAGLKSKQFLAAMPPAEKEMPMLEPAIVMSVSDAKLLKKAMVEYRQIANGLIDAVRQIEGSNVPPDLRIPKPQATTVADGTVYSFALPPELGVDKKIEPTFGLSDSVAVFCASRNHAERLLKTTPLTAGCLPGEADSPMAVAMWLNWAGLVRAATPWVDLAIDRAAAENHSSDADRKTIADQVHVGIDVLQAVQSFAAESYFDDGALVNRAVLEIHDVPK